MNQAAHTVIMIQPVAFGYNPETAGSNAFQQDIKDKDVIALGKKEFTEVIKVMKKAGVHVKIFEDTKHVDTPDAIFPNNWFFTLPDGKIVLCPMESPTRRKERRMDIISWLEEHYQVSEIIDITGNEVKERYLEGTGSIVFDHINKKAYACPSSRTNEKLFDELCERIGYKAVLFQSRDEKGNDIYHTNVLMSIGSDYAIVCLDAVHPADHEIVLENLAEDEIRVISIGYQQMKAMAGNVLELQTKGLENVLIMSKTSFDSLLPGQLDALSKKIEILTVDIPTIEVVGGGGIRCMIAGIHLPSKS